LDNAWRSGAWGGPVADPCDLCGQAPLV